MRKGRKMPFFESKSLIRGHRVGRNSAGNSKVPCSLSDRFGETMIYGKRRTSGMDLEIWEMENDGRFRKTFESKTSVAKAIRIKEDISENWRS